MHRITTANNCAFIQVQDTTSGGDDVVAADVGHSGAGDRPFGRWPGSVAQFCGN